MMDDIYMIDTVTIPWPPCGSSIHGRCAIHREPEGDTRGEIRRGRTRIAPIHSRCVRRYISRSPPCGSRLRDLASPKANTEL